MKNFGENNRYREDRIQSKGLLTILDKEVKFSNGQTGRVYLISDMRPVGIFLGRYFSSLGIIVFIILIVTNVLLTFLISTGITKQLKRLKHATEQIKDGNLNFELKTRSRDEIGDVSRAFEQMRSKLKESIDKQLQIEENRKELISSISHDLKTPVTSIKGYVEGIMDGVADSPEKMDKYIKTIYAKANDLDRLIDDLFLFSKLDLKKVPFNFEKVDLVKYFNDCIEELRIDLDKKAIKLEFENNCAENVTVMADREKLKRVIVNIIQNAVKYMDKEEKTINVNVSCSGNEALVRIRDNGQGIKEEELQFIFDRFFRTDASRNSSTGGSGLGLSITKQIIEGHEGKIWAESEYGKQTTIAFTLKIVQ
ncbi:MAG TPA: HAMP domain-containing sensor histidine kinase [Clostridia bacterium]|nr:HAMP domain-containing sensor histidine kinase [Clostridia bacterium]